MFLNTAALAVPNPTTSVSSKEGLTNAFNEGDRNITLSASLTDAVTADSDEQGVESVPTGATITLDLAGHSLDLDRIVLADGSSLTITDSSQSTSFDDDGEDRDENQLRVDASNAGSDSATAIELAGRSVLHIERATVRAIGGEAGAGIGSAAQDTVGGGSLIIDGSASVRAFGGDGGAGIGGGEGAKAIDTTVSGADVDATGGPGGAGIGSGLDGTDAGSLTTATTSSANYGYTYVSAYGGSDAAGVGGGFGGSGADVRLGSRGSLSALQGDREESSTTASAIGAGADGSAFGSLSIGANADVNLGQGSVTHVPAGSVIENAGDIELAGEIDGEGTIANTGSIDTEPRYDQNDDLVADTETHVADSLTVTGHNYLLTLDPNGGTAGADHTVHFWSSAFRSYRYAQPTPASADKVFFAWNTQADGSGTGGRYIDLSDITSAVSDGHAVPISLYATYGHPAKVTGTTIADAGLGLPYDQTIPASGDGLDYFSAGDYDDQDNPIDGLPAGLSLNSSTGRITGVPTEAGTYRVHTYVSNDYTDDSGYITIVVAGAPTIATSALPDATAGAPYSAVIRATGSGTVSYSIASGALPAGLALNGTTGAITGTPTGAGPRAFVVRATSSFGSSLQPLVLTVAPAPIPAPTPAAPVAAPAAPTLAAVGRTTVKFGHRLDLAVTANSTLPVTYRVTSGALPKGITLNAQTGVVSGAAADEGTFTAVVSATSTAGTASTAVVIDVPRVEELISTKGAVPDVKVGAGSVPLKIAGLKKGEHWTVRVDGHVVKHGTMKKSGSLSTSVSLKKAKKDTVHTVQISGSRKISDPAQRASTVFKVTSLVAKKTLKVTSAADQRGVKQVVVDRLAGGERVVVKDGSKVIAKGHADEHGDFTFPQSKAGSGKSKLTVHGATAKRAGKLTVKNPKQG